MDYISAIIQLKNSTINNIYIYIYSNILLIFTCNILDTGQRIKCVKRKKEILGPSVSITNTNTAITADHFAEDEEEERKRKKVRTTFTGRQIFELEKMFENKKYLSSSERSEMARLLNVTEQQVRHLW